MNKSHKHIIQKLITSCLEINPKIFFSELIKSDVITNMPNKMRFYIFFKYMIECLDCNSNKKMHYKWKRIKWMKKDKISLQIFDDYHKFPRLTFIIERSKTNLYIETSPF